MEIRRSPGRFLSIFLIVAIGVAFFSGIRATEPDMRYTADAYSDKYQLMDLQVISTLGLTGEDQKALEQVDGIEKVEPGCSVDVLCESGGSQKVLHVMSLLPTMNQVEVSEGRIPEKENECLVDMDFLKNSDYKVGDQITFVSGNDADLSDSLKEETYTIVGAGSSPCYISFYRGSSTIGTGSVSGFVYVPADSFSMDVYTELYAKVEGAEGLTVFTDVYDERIEEVKAEVEKIKKSRQQARYDEIVDQANEELADAEQELADAKAEAQEQLADAKQELDDGWKQLSDAKEQVKSGKAELQSGKQELLTQQATLNEKKTELENGLKTLEASQKELDQKKEELEESAKQAEEQIQAQLDTWNQQNEAVTGGISQLKAALEAQQQQYQQLKAAGADEQTLKALETSIAQTTEQLNQLQDQKTLLDQGKAQIDAAKEKTEKELEAGRKQVQDGQTQIDQTKAELQSGQAKLADGQSQIDQGWEKIRTSAATFAEAEEEIAANEQKLKDGQQSYEEGKAEADEKIADGEKKLADAKDEVSKIEHAKWYINDRSALTEYDGYGENADRIAAIGKVFPVLFFLVAALISLTTMTRMVEEQRTLIGTLKALGYSKGSIAAKYLGYAFLASAGGSVLGILIGEKTLPKIILVAYGIMYGHIDTYRIPYEGYYAVMASVAAMLCTVGAAWTVCRRELKESAAELMRPPAPKNGKRVFLERLGGVWKRLSFSWKATVRNLIRYKKRFFMTIFGIGGCMSLLLVGFGLEDSISNIARLQYGEVQCYDGNLILDSSATTSEQEDAVQTLKSDKRVSEVEKTVMEQVNVKAESGKKKLDVYLVVPEDVEKYKDFVTFQNRVTKEAYTLQDGGVILSEKASSLLKVKAGDQLVIKDDVQGEIKVKIDQVCENYMGHYIYMTPETYKDLFKREPEYNAACFQMNPEDVSKIERVGEKVLKSDGALSMSYMTEIEDQVDSMLSSLDFVLLVLILSAGMLAFVVLYNLNNINITERRRELATLKVLGFYDGEVSAYVYRENVILTLIGTILGCGMGTVLHRFVITTAEIDTVMFGRNIDPTSYLYSALITVGFSLFVNWVMYYKLKKINMVESMKSVE